MFTSPATRSLTTYRTDAVASLARAVLAGESAAPLLADAMEEAGCTGAVLHDLRSGQRVGSIAAMLAGEVAAVPAKRPILADEVAALFAASYRTARERLDAFVAVDVSGRHGAPLVRERQQAVCERLRKIQTPARASVEATPANRSKYAAMSWAQQTWCRSRKARHHLKPSENRPSDRHARRAQSSEDGAFAVEVAESFHDRVKNLYTSDRASIVYGHGGHDGYDGDAYSKTYRSKFGGAKWKDAGARVEYADHPKQRGAGTIVIETARGTEVARLPLPADRDSIVFSGLLDGDLWAVRRVLCGREILTRFGLRRKKLARTGLAVWVPTGTNEKGQKVGHWEHGDTIGAIKAEIRHKEEVRRKEAEAKALSEREQRFARLVAAICPRLVVTYDDARACGYCAAGIQGFQERFGLAGRTETTAAELRHTGSVEAERPIQQAARRVAKARLAE